MNHVFILDSNYDNAFSSLLMNDLNNLGIGFSNVKTTKSIEYRNNIGIYIPVVNNVDNALKDLIFNNKCDFSRFRHVFLILTNHIDYDTIKTQIGLTLGLFNTSTFKYYESLGFNTLLSKIVTEDCKYLFDMD